MKTRLQTVTYKATCHVRVIAPCVYNIRVVAPDLMQKFPAYKVTATNKAKAVTRTKHWFERTIEESDALRARLPDVPQQKTVVQWLPTEDE
jgi:hypothetical protein